MQRYGPRSEIAMPVVLGTEFEVKHWPSAARARIEGMQTRVLPHIRNVDPADAAAAKGAFEFEPLSIPSPLVKTTHGHWRKNETQHCE